MNGALHKGLGGSMLAAAAVAGMGLLVAPGEARADRNWSFHVGVGDHYRPVRRTHVRLIATEPVYELRTRRIWIPPEYAERAVTVRIPAVVETREVPTYDYYGNVIGYRLVREVTEPARTERRIEAVVVRPGYYKTVTERVIVERPDRRVVRHRTVIDRHRGGAGFHIGFEYGKHREHKYRSHRRLRRLVRYAH